METPDFDQRPSELARRFKELYSNEWTDAYDEICKDFGSEKTVRHLLWIVTVSWYTMVAIMSIIDFKLKRSIFFMNALRFIAC